MVKLGRQGEGGGRPTRPDARVRIVAELPAEKAELLKAYADAERVPLWKILDRLIEAGLEGGPPPETLPPLALEIANEVAAFLATQENPRNAARAIRRAWEQTIVLARHDLKS